MTMSTQEADSEGMTHRIALIVWGSDQQGEVEATLRDSRKQVYLLSCLAACCKWTGQPLRDALLRRLRNLQFLDKILDRGMTGKVILIADL